MSVSIVVPFTPDGAERERNWRYLQERYCRAFPQWEIVLDAGRAGEWSKGSAVNAAAERASGQVFVILDADLLLSPNALIEAVAEVEGGAPWCMPHGTVYRLSERRTVRLLREPDGLPDSLRLRDQARAPRRGPTGGGCLVLKREAFEAVCGMDERFIGWGGEDISFGRALDTLVGSHMRLWEPAWHLWHEPLPMRPGRRGSVETEALAGRYLEAVGDPKRMAALVAR